jgi:hypothetical protein
MTAAGRCPSRFDLKACDDVSDTMEQCPDASEDQQLVGLSHQELSADLKPQANHDDPRNQPQLP